LTVATGSEPAPAHGLALVFGASGYMGSHLVPRLQAAGWPVRAVARHAGPLRARGWTGVDLVAADALWPDTLAAALQGVDVAWYLVHSMAAGDHFPELDRQAAANFRDAAAQAGVRRIVYLGGLQPAAGQGSSAHMASRGETGDVLRQGPVPVTELRAGIIIGPGSAAFEVIRDLVFHLPAMVTPRWVRSRSQPVALDDVLDVLLRLPLLPAAAGQTYDIGGPEVLSYLDLMQQFARLVGRRPLIVPVPLLSPRLSAFGLNLLTTVPNNVARALIGGLAHDLVADDTALRGLIPLRLHTYRQAVQAVLDAERRVDPASGVHDGSTLLRHNRVDFAYYPKTMQGEAVAQAPAAALWHAVASIGGDQGYYFLDALWSLRGRLDRLVGGNGLRRGRRDAKDLVVGDQVDFWRVVALQPGQHLTLLAEMKLPGSAALSFDVQPLSDRQSRVTVTARFHPAGAPGLAYWHALGPVHAALFPGMARAIAQHAVSAAAGAPAVPAPAAETRGDMSGNP
jgi:uncharacterized protein YbjT (DUF2867 family)